MIKKNVFCGLEKMVEIRKAGHSGPDTISVRAIRTYNLVNEVQPALKGLLY